MKPVVVVILSLLLPATLAVGEDKFSEEQLEFFETNIRPALVKFCYECHKSDGDDAPEAGLELDHLAGLLKGGDTGPAVVAGAPDKSLLIHAIDYTDSDSPEQGDYYYVRVTQLDGGMAWSSPIWVG